MKLSATLFAVLMFATVILGQKPTVMDKTSDTTAPKAAPAPAPQTMKAKYEGGVFGFRKKQTGTLRFDDLNSRLIFRNDKEQELFSIPYSSVSQAFADTQARRPAAASVISQIPVPYGLNIPAAFIKKKYQYVTMQFYDDQSHVGGVTSFKLADKALVTSVVNALANKAGLVPQGDIFVRERQRPSSTRVQVYGNSSEAPAVVVEDEVLSQRVISLPRPVYPEEAKASKTTGTVRVSVTLDEQGRVTDAEVISGVRALQAAAVEAARKAVFEPISRGGVPVKTRVVIAYIFQL